MPRAPAGHGLTAQQRLRRRSAGRWPRPGTSRCSASRSPRPRTPTGCSCPPTTRGGRRSRLANPISEDEPLLRTTLLPGLLRVLARNVGRGFADVALYRDGPGVPARAPAGRGSPRSCRWTAGRRPRRWPRWKRRLPDQPLHLGVVLAGDRELAGWWGAGRAAGWQDAIEAAREVLRLSRVPFRVAADQHAPWHPGRCAARPHHR